VRGHDAASLPNGNNEYNSAFLAAFPKDAAPVFPPQTASSPYYCNDCPRLASAFKFFLFPPTEIHSLQNIPFHTIFSLNVNSEGVEVQTFEGRDPTVAPQELIGVYDFTPDFELRSAALSDTYWNLHRRLEREGKMHHPAARCPDRDPASRMSAVYSLGAWTQVRRLSAAR